MAEAAEATEQQIADFKRCRVLHIRELTGNAYNAVGVYDEIAHLSGKKVHVACTITDEDAIRYMS